MNYYIGDYPPNEFDAAPRGWICPKCGRVYNPTTPMCFYCNGENITNTTTATPSYKLPDIETSLENIPIHYNVLSFFE